MAKISELGEQTDLTGNEYLEILDPDDTSMAVTGTNKKVPIQKITAQTGPQVLLETITWSADTTKQVTIPAGYEEIIIEGIDFRGARASATENIAVFFNSDTTDTNYLTQWNAAQANGGQHIDADNSRFCLIPGASAPANETGWWQLRLKAYENTSAHRKIRASYHNRYGTGDAATGERTVHHDTMTAAITTLDITAVNDTVDGTMKVWGVRDLTIQNSDTLLTRVEVPVTYSGGEAVIDLTSQQTGQKVIVEWEGIASTAATTSDGLQIFFNDDYTVTNYRLQQNSAGNGSGAENQFNQSDIASLPGTSSGAGAVASGYMEVVGYATPGLEKIALGVSSQKLTATTLTSDRNAVSWNTSDPITKIALRTDNHATDTLTGGVFRAYVEKQGVIAANPNWVELSQAEYDALGTPDPNTIYLITS